MQHAGAAVTDVENVRALLDRVGRVVAGRRRSARLLEEIAWPREVEEAFFAAGAARLPEVRYDVDRAELEDGTAQLGAVRTEIAGDDPISSWLRATLGSLIDGARLVLAAGTPHFYPLSRELYGSARTPFVGGAVCNLDLADHLLERLSLHGWDEAQDAEAPAYTAPEFAEMLRRRVAAREPRLDVEVVVDKRCSAKVVAGATRVRVRADATFLGWEAEGLWAHEVETHVLTAQNGAAQPAAPFLRGGGPRSTRTQEGLAIFAELRGHALSIKRLERLAVRVKLVDMAEQGASFLDLYRWLMARGSAPRDAYLDAQRVCRGGLVAGGAPFTKDAGYLAGLLQVYAFLTAFIRGGFRDEVELIVCGRIDLDDLDALVRLRQMGLLARPTYMPAWLASWQTLLPYFAFTSFMDDIDLEPVERHFQKVIALSLGARPR